MMVIFVLDLDNKLAINKMEKISLDRKTNRKETQTASESCTAVPACEVDARYKSPHALI